MYARFLFDASQLSLLSPLPVALAMGANPATIAPVQDVGALPPKSIAESFAALAGATRSRMQTLSAQPLQIADHFRRRTSLNGKFTLQAEAWRLQFATQACILRMVTIDGAKSHIINTWIFPCTPQACPVFAAELIGVGDAVRVAFIDIQAPVAQVRCQQLATRLRSLSQSYASLPCDEAAPDWATDASLGHFTYARNVELSQLSSVHDCTLGYLDLYLDHARSIRTSSAARSETSAAVEQLHAYQLHHMEHSPGKKFLGNLFGSEWTESFMLDFLFTRP